MSAATVTVIESTGIHEEVVQVEELGDGLVVLTIEAREDNEWGTRGWYVTLTHEERNTLADALRVDPEEE